MGDVKETPLVGDVYQQCCLFDDSLPVMCTAFVVVRTMADSWHLKYEQVPVQKISQTAALTVIYASMLVVLFLAVRMCLTWLKAGRHSGLFLTSQQLMYRSDLLA